MYTINPGEFKHPIEIKTVKTGGVDDDNIPIKVESTLLETRAKIRNKTGRETIIANGEASITTKLFIIRYPREIEITDKYKLLYKEKLYDITYVNNVEDLNKYLEIVCELVE